MAKTRIELFVHFCLRQAIGPKCRHDILCVRTLCCFLLLAQYLTAFCDSNPGGKTTLIVSINSMGAPCVCGMASKIPTRGVPKTFVNETAVPMVCQHGVAGSAVPRNACRYQRTKTGTGGRFWEAVIVRPWTKERRDVRWLCPRFSSCAALSPANRCAAAR